VSKTQILIDVLLGIGALASLFGVLGVLAMKDLYEKLHYLSLPATISICSFTIAIVIDKHFSTAGIKAVIIAIVILLMNAVLTHATARAARVRQFGRWLADVTEVRGVKDQSTAGLNSQPVVDSTDEPAGAEP
jgi:monovalent cation/proton antiporter MnhG/PhaG subunit